MKSIEFYVLFLFLFLSKEIKAVIGSLEKSVRREHRTAYKRKSSFEHHSDLTEDVQETLKTEKASKAAI